MKKSILIAFIFIIPMFYSSLQACTIIAAGKKATADGSVIVSHTDAGPDCRVHVMPGQFFKEGTLAPVYWGMVDLGRPLGDYGDTLGMIPQVTETYSYFQSAYPQMNEWQLTIGESTTSMRDELKLDEKTCKQIMTVEQAQAFALQRCKTAREALKLITALMEKYGFRPSCVGESETLVLGDPNEVWVLEIFAVGNDWSPGSGKPGALWAAQRLPDDHVTMIPNWSIIKHIDIQDTGNFRASVNYKSIAVEHGWYDPESGEDFVWQDVYAPIPREWATSRFWLFYSTFADLPGIPNRWTTDPFKGEDQYTQYVEPLSIYPFSAKPAKKITVQDIMAFQRSTFSGTIYDKEIAPGWYYPGPDGKMVRSSYATPFPTAEMRKLLKINKRRNVARARGEYGMIAQVRGWLPREIGGIYWFFVDNAFTSAYVPMYSGVTDVAECYKIYDKDKYDENSMRWAVDFVDNLLYLKWQDAVKDLHAVRDPLEKRFFDEQPEVDSTFQALYKKSPKKAKKYITDLTIKRQEETLKMFHDLRDLLITKYTNNKQGI